MKSNALMEALHSLKQRFRKNILESRAGMIFLWFQFAFLVGMTCFFLSTRVLLEYDMARLKAASPQFAAQGVNMISDHWWIVFCSSAIGFPVFMLALGIWGILPGTRRRKK